MLFGKTLRERVFGVTRKLQPLRKPGRGAQSGRLILTTQTRGPLLAQDQKHHLPKSSVSMDSGVPARFIITANGATSKEESLELLRDAKLLCRGRWSVECILTEQDPPYLFVTFTRYNIGVSKFKAGLGQLQWLVNIQRVPGELTAEEAIQYQSLVIKYDVQSTQELDLETTEESGYRGPAKSWGIKKRKL
uniref:Nonstructural protein 2 n=1 Tax=Turdus pallidus Chaphamaparvovirus TaxID=2794492 RepID=A0A8A4XDY9_9VIRU|nr:MAG: nonstructural protein 2 [Turdus pallidus Chaphamaparvovirus]